jgi:hypothetical protein
MQLKTLRQQHSPENVRTIRDGKCKNKYTAPTRPENKTTNYIVETIQRKRNAKKKATTPIATTTKTTTTAKTKATKTTTTTKKTKATINLIPSCQSKEIFFF